MNLIDYSKALFHLKNLESTIERAKNEVNLEDISVEFLFNCMTEKIQKEKELKSLHENIKSSFFQAPDYCYKLKSINFIAFQNKEDLLKYINKYKIKDFNIIENISAFKTDKNKLLVPENEINIIKKQYIYLGKVFILIIN